MLPKRILRIDTNGYGSSRPILAACDRQVARLHGDWELLTIRCGDGLLDSRQREFYSYLSQAKRAAAVQSDLLKLAALYRHGGIVLDGDLFLLRPMGEFLDHDLVVANINPPGYPVLIGEHFIGARDHDPRIKQVLDYFINQTIDTNGEITMFLSGFVRRYRWPYLPSLVTCPHQRWEPDTPQVNYRHDDSTVAIHLWSNHTYSAASLLEIAHQCQS